MKQICIITCDMYPELMNVMLKTAKLTAPTYKIRIQNVFSVPGSLEIPLLLDSILKNNVLKKRYSGMIVFGLIRQGQTKHGEVLGHQITDKILSIQLKYMMPMAVSIIGPCSTLKHATKKAVTTAKKAIVTISKMINELEKIKKMK